MNKQERQVNRHLKELEKMGLVKIVGDKVFKTLLGKKVYKFMKYKKYL